MIKVSLFQSEGDLGPSAIPLFGPSDPFFEKVAAPSLVSDVSKYIEGLKPRNDSQYVLVNAMGAYEWFGSNVNGDAFTEASLIHCPDNWTGNPLLDSIRAKDWPYGFPTFYSAKAFAHHRNKDPGKSLGDVELACWNNKMKRVELVVRLDKDLCQRHGGTGAWDKLKGGDYPAVSMGTKVPFDTCSICLDWKLYREAQSSFDPKKHKYEGEAVLQFHKNLQKKGKGIRGLSITRKDYCFPPGTPILMADGLLRPIEEVRVGDEVVSHTGLTRRVTNLLPSTRADSLIKIHPWGMLPLESSGNHPFLATTPTGAQSRESWLDRHRPDWVSAEDLEEGSIVFSPIVKITAENEQSVPAGSGLLLGLYLAEGNLNYSRGVGWPKSSSFTFSKKEGHLVEAVVAEALKLDPDATIRKFEYSGKEALGVTINSRGIASWLLSLGGEKSRSKRLSPGLWSMGSSFCRDVLLGWSLGDGCRDKRNLRVATASEELARQMQSLASSLGILGGLSRLERETNFGHQVIWYLSFNGDAAEAVYAKRSQSTRSNQSKLFFWEGYLASSVRKIDIEERYGEWFNFEVEEDHSYVAGGLAVHNCDHCLKGMNRILPDGRKIFVYNDYPRFFDISFVFIGADKTAYAMMKIADAGKKYSFLGGAELAEYLGYAEDGEKTASGKIAKSKAGEITKDVVPSQFAGKAVPLLTKDEPDLPPEVLALLRGMGGSRALSTTAGMGIVLRPHEFEEVVPEGTVDISPDAFSSALAQALLPLMAARSGLGPFVERRVLLISTQPNEKGGKHSSLSSNHLHKIGTAYREYRSAIMNLLPEAQNMIGTTSSEELSKLARAEVEEVFTPLSYQYFKTAFLDEGCIDKVSTMNIGLVASADVERGTPSRNTYTSNVSSGG